MAAASSCHCGTAPRGGPPTGAAATCWTPSRARTWAGTTRAWWSTSTSPTTRRAPTTRAGPVRWHRKATGCRRPSPPASNCPPAAGTEPASTEPAGSALGEDRVGGQHQPDGHDALLQGLVRRGTDVEVLHAGELHAVGLLEAGLAIRSLRALGRSAQDQRAVGAGVGQLGQRRHAQVV